MYLHRLHKHPFFFPTPTSRKTDTCSGVYLILVCRHVWLDKLSVPVKRLTCTGLFVMNEESGKRRGFSMSQNNNDEWLFGRPDGATGVMLPIVFALIVVLSALFLSSFIMRMNSESVERSIVRLIEVGCSPVRANVPGGTEILWDCDGQQFTLEEFMSGQVKIELSLEAREPSKLPRQEPE